jgi:hypothetical protein
MGKFYYERGGQYVRPQKHGKGPFGSALVCAEAEGPVRFDGWNSTGMTVGRPWASPWIQVTAATEDQSANVWRALMPMAEQLKHWDIGETRINLPSGGRIEPTTASAKSRLGQRLTFALQDETHSWLDGNGGTKLADTQRRNIAGMKGRWVETTNAWDPRENSVAQRTNESGEPGVLLDDVDGGAGSVRNKQERRAVLKKVYAGSEWVDLGRISAEIDALLSRGEAAQAERFFLNRKQAGEDAAFAPETIDARVLEHAAPDGALVVLGVDGARFADALAVVATEVETGHQWPVGIWERPEHSPEAYEHPVEEIDGAVSEAFERFSVWRAYCDPQWIDHLVERWQGRWGAKRVISWYTNRPRQIAWAVRGYTDALNSGDTTHSGDPTLVRHLKNARRQKLSVYDDQHRQMHSLSKDRHDSPRKIDGAMAAVLSWEARGDAIAAGAKPERRGRVAGFR